MSKVDKKSINIDKELEKILWAADDSYGSEISITQAIAQIKSTILEAIKKDMPKEKNNDKDIRAIWDDTDFAVDYRLGYNRCLADCLEVINKLLGDSNE